ncbi:Alg13 UDP-N-acetylglucosaminyltransferase subunit [Carabus blaptoides fortunei]
MATQNVFVTVGTTKFDKLIETVTSAEVLHILSSLGYDSVTLQIGNGSFEPVESNIIKISYYRLKPSIKDDIRNARLVISHAGAGSCLEVMSEHKPLIAVINEDLMGNHQQEIAKALSNRGHLKYCNCSDLSIILECRQFEHFKLYRAENSRRFTNYLDKCIGFSV